jgi:hypothetical protein
MGHARGKKCSFGEGLYSLWLHMDLLVMCTAKKTKWDHFAKWFPWPPMPTMLLPQLSGFCPPTHDTYLNNSTTADRTDRGPEWHDTSCHLSPAVCSFRFFVLTNLSYFLDLTSCHYWSPMLLLRASARRVVTGPFLDDNATTTTAPDDNTAVRHPTPVKIGSK